MHLHYAGSLTAHNAKCHIQHSFDVPDQAEVLNIEFRFAPAGAHSVSNMLTLTVFDPDGFRGAGHRGGSQHQVRITIDNATPGYLPGPLPAGPWIAVIDTHMIMPGEPLKYSLDLMIETASSTDHGNHPEEMTSARKPAHRGRSGLIPSVGRPQAAWYCGDLHAHSHHSDAAEFTVADLLAAARLADLDFVFLTDHNTIAGLHELEDDHEGILAAGGIELTTFWGHALQLGGRNWVDWRVRPGTGEIARIVASARAQDQVFIIAHPQSVGDPTCTGCAWRFGEMMPGKARFVEVWNGPWWGDSNNEASLALWYDWLNQGWRLVATAGTDAHGAGFARRASAGLGFSVIYAEALTEPALLDGLRAGHLYLSAGPRLLTEIQQNASHRWMMGDTLPRLDADEPLSLRVRWAGCPAKAQLYLIANGRRWTTQTIEGAGSATWQLTPKAADWVLAELRGRDGDLLGVTNPIFLAPTHQSRPEDLACGSDLHPRSVQRPQPKTSAQTSRANA